MSGRVTTKNTNTNIHTRERERGRESSMSYRKVDWYGKWEREGKKVINKQQRGTERERERERNGWWRMEEKVRREEINEREQE